MTRTEFRAIRGELGLSAEKMARVLGLSGGRQVRQYESGGRAISASMARLARLAAELYRLARELKADEGMWPAEVVFAPKRDAVGRARNALALRLFAALGIPCRVRR